MLRRYALVCALTILFAGCGDVHRVEVRTEPGQYPRQVEYDALPTPDAVALWDATVLWHATETFNAELDRQAAARAKAEARRRVSTSSAKPSHATGGHSDAWWHGVAICEQSGRNDDYYGYFSFMDGSAAGKSWDEQVAMGNALLAKVGHEVGPWAASCVAAGYRASPGG